MGIKELLQRVAEDKEFAAKYYAIHSVDAVLAEAKKDGYSITEEEFSEMLKAVNNREITDAEAAEATGGGGTLSVLIWDDLINAYKPCFLLPGQQLHITN